MAFFLSRFLLASCLTKQLTFAITTHELPAGAPLPNLDLVTMIQKPSVHQPEVFTHALGVIQTLQRAPSCNRLATATLIDSCRTLEAVDDRSPHGPNHALDQVKSAFAARLAVCELSGAHASIPPQCQAMAPRERPGPDRSFKCMLPNSDCAAKVITARRSGTYYERVGQKQMTQCLAALESKPQWWTSYSNARQNAISICHASRLEADRDELLKMHRSMVSVTSDLSGALDETIKRSSANAESQRRFAEAIKQMQAEAFGDLEIAQADAQNRLGSMLQSMEEKMLVSFGYVSERVWQVATNVVGLREAVQESSSEVDSVQRKLRALMTDAQEQSESMAAAQRQEWGSQKEIAISVQGSLVAVRDNEIAGLTAAFAGLQTELRASSQLMALMYDQQSTHNRWLQHLDTAFARLTDSAASLQVMQQDQASNQTQLLNDLQTRMETTEKHFGSIFEKMVALASVIDEKTALIGALGFFGGAATMARLMLMAFVTGAVALINRKVAGCFAVLFTTAFLVGQPHLVESFDATTSLARAILPGQSSIHHYWPAVVPLAGFAIGLVLLWSRSKKTHGIGEKTRLP